MAKGERRGERIISHNVQAVLYLRDDDGEPYVHGFGDADLELHTHRDGAVTIGRLKDRTGVELVLKPDGSVLLRGPAT